MKKIFFALFVLSIFTVSGLFLTGCSEKKANLDENEIGTQLATSAFMSQGFLSNETTMVSASNITLSNVASSTVSTTEIDRRVDQFMLFFDKLNVFLDGNPKVALNIEQSSSSKEGFESKVSYDVNGVVHVIHYNITDASEDNDLEEQEFSLEGILEFGSKSFTVIGGTEIEDGEIEMYFETHETDSDNYVRVEIEKESNEQFFQIDSYINGVDSYSEIRLEKDGLDGAIEITIWDGQVSTTIEIQKEVDGNETIYRFEYNVGDVSGSITLRVSIDENGNEERHFSIQEGEFYKEFSKIIPTYISGLGDIV